MYFKYCVQNNWQGVRSGTQFLALHARKNRGSRIQYFSGSAHTMG